MLGTPPARGSGATAVRSARATALNWASTMWCGLRPSITRTCRQIPAANASDSKKADAPKKHKKKPATQAQREKEIVERRHEIEHLETRIGHARQRMLEIQCGLIDSRPVGTSIPPQSTESARATIAPDDPFVPDPRWSGIAQVAIELADQRLWLSEQMARLEHARREWMAERDAAAAELRELTQALDSKELNLYRQTNDLAAAQERSQTEHETLTQMRLRQEAEHARRESV